MSAGQVVFCQSDIYKYDQAIFLVYSRLQDKLFVVDDFCSYICRINHSQFTLMLMFLNRAKCNKFWGSGNLLSFTTLLTIIIMLGVSGIVFINL